MKSHELAKILLQCPNLPVATHANNHDYISGIDDLTHGNLRIALLHTYGGDHVIIGNFSKKNLNEPNWYIKKVLDEKKDLPDSW